MIFGEDIALDEIFGDVFFFSSSFPPFLLVLSSLVAFFAAVSFFVLDDDLPAVDFDAAPPPPFMIVANSPGLYNAEGRCAAKFPATDSYIQSQYIACN